MSNNFIKRSEDFAKWYTNVVISSNLADYGLVKGTMIVKPYGWSVWTNIQKYLDEKLKEVGTENCMFPLFIPYSKFMKEKEHIKGFSPELFKVEYLNNEKLEDSLVIRPTSEISFCDYFSKLALSYQTLPIKLNQWCNVFRAEKNTRPFLRTSEFFWQEQHAIFANEKEAKSFALEMIQIYQNFIEKILCIPAIVGYKTENEKFAGADITYTIEAIMQDGQALQIATSHYLGKNFSIPFNIKFQNEENKFENVFQTSAGSSTRLIGALIMSHSDDNGLVLPFNLAPYQFVINLIDVDTNNLFYLKILNLLKMQNFTTKTDSSKKNFGYKINKYETEGIPFQIIIGKKEIENNQITLYRRDTLEKQFINLDDLSQTFFWNLISSYDKNLFNKAKLNSKNKIVEVNNYKDFVESIKQQKVVLVNWNGTKEDEEQIKKDTGATPRCILDLDYSKQNLTCFYTNKANAKKVYFARAY